MAQQHINLGTAPAGIDGDTNRTANVKMEANFTELYTALDGSASDATTALAAATAAQTAATAAGAAAGTAQAAAVAAQSTANTGVANAATAQAAAVVAQGTAAAAGTAAAGALAAALGADTFKNLLINGNMNWWQRGSTFAAAAGTSYTADRWARTTAGSTIASSSQLFGLGQTLVPGNPKNFYRAVVASVAGATNNACVQQSIEGVGHAAGQTVSVGFWAKADVARHIALEFIQSFGTTGAPSASVLGNGSTYNIALTPAWAYYTVQIPIPSIAGKTIGTDGNDALVFRIWLDAGTSYNARTGNLGQQSGTFDFTQVQVEINPTATSFEFLPIQTELALCQRYYVAGSHSYTAPLIGTGVAACYASYQFPVTMRGVPAITTANFVDNDSIGAGGVLSVVVDANGILRTATTGTPTKTGRLYYTFNADAEL